MGRRGRVPGFVASAWPQLGGCRIGCGLRWCSTAVLP